MPAEPAPTSDADPATRLQATTAVHQRRTVRTLVVSQVLGGVGVAGGITAGGLLAEEVSGSTSVAGLAQTATVLGAALLAVPLARVAAARDRRAALAGGYAIGLAGALLTLLAAVAGWLWLVLLGSALFGGGTASNLQARYAATDSATPATRGRALSVVVWATTVGAVAGPNLVGPGAAVADVLGLPRLAGPYLFSVVSFAAGAAVVLALLRSAPAADPDGASGASGRAARAPGPRLLVVLTEVWRVPRARLAVTGIAAAHAVMVGVMVMTPVHLGHGGATLTVVGVVISLHVAGMYAASPVMGWLTDRLGPVRALGAGCVVLLTSLLLAATSPGAPGAPGEELGHVDYGSEPVQVAAALTLLGLGWSACVVAGSALLAEAAPEPVRVPAQGASDMVMGLAGAGAGALAGPVLAAAGYGRLSLLAGLLLLPVLTLAVVLLRGRRAATPL
ncbi:MFS transporter [Thalassiella azotivora]